MTLRATVLVLLFAPELFAQEAPSLPAGPPPLMAGPVNLYPGIALRDIRIRFQHPRRSRQSESKDYTFTTEPRIRAVLPFGATQLSGSAAVGFVYYATFKDEQSINRLFTGRFEEQYVTVYFV